MSYNPMFPKKKEGDSLIPSRSGLSLGSEKYPWKHAYVSEKSINVGGVKISSKDNAIQFVVPGASPGTQSIVSLGGTGLGIKNETITTDNSGVETIATTVVSGTIQGSTLVSTGTVDASGTITGAYVVSTGDITGVNIQADGLYYKRPSKAYRGTRRRIGRSETKGKVRSGYENGGFGSAFVCVVFMD